MDKYNGEDLETLFAPKWQLMTASFFPNKSLDKLFAIAEMVKTISPDILMLVEVGGKESLDNFNKYFLDNKYDVLLEPSNSDRGIDLGYMVKKDLPLNAKLISHTKKVLSNKKKFARGVFELQLFKDEKLIFKNYLSHLKSKLNMSGNDFEGRGQRGAEVEYLVSLFEKDLKSYPDLPVCFSGDFNGIVYKDDTEEELKPIVDQTQLLDIFEILDLPIEKRMTYCYFNRVNQRHLMQLDYIFINKKFKSSIVPNKTQILGFIHPFTDTYELPVSFKEKRDMPSDHMPVRLTLKI
jgi:hypothetical protein